MPASEIRKEARDALKGKWGKAVCIILAYLAISFVVGCIQGLFKEGSAISIIINIAYTVISIPLSFGLIISFIKLKRDEETSAFGFLSEGFSRFGKSWGITWRIFLKMLVPIIVLMVAVILFTSIVIVQNGTVINSAAQQAAQQAQKVVLTILFVILYIACLVYAFARSLLYSLAYYIAYDHPELSSKACVEESERFMKGNRGNIFLLYLSFIGWSILAILTLCIGYLWLIPYMEIAMVCFYERVAKSEAKKVEGTVDIQIEE